MNSLTYKTNLINLQTYNTYSQNTYNNKLKTLSLAKKRN